MKKILILEDNKYKLESVKKWVNHHFGECVIVHHKAFNVAASTLLNGDFDLAILDNMVPRFTDTDSIIVDKAIESLLAHMEFDECKTPVIGCSSEDVMLRHEYANYLGFIKYSAGLDCQKQFDLLCNKVEELKASPSLEDAVKDLQAIAQEALQNIEKASTDYADSKLPESPYSKHTMRKQTLYDWSDIAEAFEAGVRYVANKHNITF